MDIKPTRSDADYRVALKEIENLMTAVPDTPEGEKLNQELGVPAESLIKPPRVHV